MSRYYTDLCWLDGHLKLGRLTMMLALSRHADDDGVSCRSQPQLALETRLTDRQVRRLVTELAKTDHLEVIHSGDGRGNKTCYQLFPTHVKVDIFDTKADKMSTFNDEVASKKVDIFDSGDPVKVDIFDTKPEEMSTFTSHAGARARSGWVGRSLSTTNTSKKKKTTYPPKPSQTDPPLEPLQQLALDLLEDSDVGVLHETALMLVLTKPVQDIYRAVDKWLPDAQVGKVTAGVLKHRLEALKPSRAATVHLSPAFRDSELFHRHRLPDDLVADAERKIYSGGPPADEPRRKYSE